LEKPKIAVLIDWYLPGTKAGGPVRSVYSLVSLLKPYFNFYVITTNIDLGETFAYKEINPNTLFLKEDVHYFYFSHDRLNANAVLNLFKEIKPDLIYLNSFWSFNFSINIIRLKNKKHITTPILLAPRGMLGKGALGIKSLKKQVFLTLAKISGWYRNISFHATQQQEERDIRDHFKSARIIIAPNVNSASVKENKSQKGENKLRLFYLSRIASVKNLHFALEILKDIPPDFSVLYDIYGNLEDMEYWQRCQSVIEKLPKNISVTYKRELSFNEVQEVISNYNCLFLPTLNENFGHSIVESLLCGCPVIISDQTPWNDLENYNAGFALSLNDKQKFVNAIVHYAKMNDIEFSKNSKEAIKYISSKIDIQKIVDQYKNLFYGGIKN
jgi:glycosyltransferase involved in cell wall biosynthesis